MNVIKEFDNKLLKRKEFLLAFTNSNITLNRKEIKDQVVKKYKVKEELIVVNHIDQKFRKADIVAQVFVYENDDALKKVSNKHILKRNGLFVEEKEGGEE